MLEGNAGQSINLNVTSYRAWIDDGHLLVVRPLLVFISGPCCLVEAKTISWELWMMKGQCDKPESRLLSFILRKGKGAVIQKTQSILWRWWPCHAVLRHRLSSQEWMGQWTHFWHSWSNEHTLWLSCSCWILPTATVHDFDKLMLVDGWLQVKWPWYKEHITRLVQSTYFKSEGKALAWTPFSPLVARMTAFTTSYIPSFAPLEQGIASH
jgi:hypothetical protein